MILAVDRRRNGPRLPTLPWIIGVLTITSLLGGVATRALGAIGFMGTSTNERLMKLEVYDSLRKRTVDSMFHQLADDNEETRELVLMLVSMRCLEPSQAARQAAADARVPCARIINEQGIDPP